MAMHISCTSSLSNSTIGVDSPSKTVHSSGATVVSATKMSLEIILYVDEVSSIVTVVIVTDLISQSNTSYSSTSAIIPIVVTWGLITSPSSIVAVITIVSRHPLAQSSSLSPGHVQVAEVPPHRRQPRVLTSIPAQVSSSSQSLVATAEATIGSCIPPARPLLKLSQAKISLMLYFIDIHKPCRN